MKILLCTNPKISWIPPIWASRFAKIEFGELSIFLGIGFSIKLMRFARIWTVWLETRDLVVTLLLGEQPKTRFWRTRFLSSREFAVLREHLWGFNTPPLMETVTWCVLWSLGPPSVTIGTLCNDFVKFDLVTGFSDRIGLEALWARDHVSAHFNQQKVPTTFSELSRVKIML